MRFANITLAQLKDHRHDRLLYMGSEEQFVSELRRQGLNSIDEQLEAAKDSVVVFVPDIESLVLYLREHSNNDEYKHEDLLIYGLFTRLDNLSANMIFRIAPLIFNENPNALLADNVDLDSQVPLSDGNGNGKSRSLRFVLGRWMDV